jgi:hypothetical protein
VSDYVIGQEYEVTDQGGTLRRGTYTGREDGAGGVVFDVFRTRDRMPPQKGYVHVFLVVKESVSAALYLSHGASGEWFIVEPRANPLPQVRSLLRAGRTVYEAEVTPWQGARSGHEARQQMAKGTKVLEP